MPCRPYLNRKNDPTLGCAHWRSGFSWRAAVLGAGFSAGGQAFLGTLVAVVSQRVWMAKGASREQAASLLASSFFSTVGLLSMLATVCAAALGNYISAHYGRGRPVVQASAAGALGLLFPLVMLASPEAQTGPIWFFGWSFGIPMASAIFGGYLYGLRKPSRHGT